VALAGTALAEPWPPTGRGNAVRFGVRPEWQAALEADHKDVPVRQAAGMLFSVLSDCHPLRGLSPVFAGTSGQLARFSGICRNPVRILWARETGARMECLSWRRV